MSWRVTARVRARAVGLAGFLVLLTLQPLCPAFAEPKFVEMPPPSDGEYVTASSVGTPGKGRHWGTPAMIRHLILVAREWKKRHPEGPVLRIGDISKPNGGKFPPHKTHQDGLAVDITTFPNNLCHITWKKQELTLELAELFVHFGARQILYNHAAVHKKVACAQPYPKHDDHFHVVVNPAGVPQDGVPVVVAGKDSGAGVVIGTDRLKAGGRGLVLSAELLGGTVRGLKYRLQVADNSDEAHTNGDKAKPLHDSGRESLRRLRFKVPLELKNGAALRWCLELFRGDEEKAVASLPWTPFTVDLLPPAALAKRPIADAETSTTPLFEWKASDNDRVTGWRVELSRSRSGRRPIVAGEGTDGETSFRLEKRVPSRRKLYWRVVLSDRGGNIGATSWRPFTPKASLDPAEPSEPDVKRGTITAGSLNVRSGPGVSHGRIGALVRDAEVKILRETPEGWYEIECVLDGRVRKGFVSSKYVKLVGS